MDDVDAEMKDAAGGSLASAGKKQNQNQNLSLGLGEVPQPAESLSLGEVPQRATGGSAHAQAISFTEYVEACGGCFLETGTFG